MRAIRSGYLRPHERAAARERDRPVGGVPPLREGIRPPASKALTQAMHPANRCAIRVATERRSRQYPSAAKRPEAEVSPQGGDGAANPRD